LNNPINSIKEPFFHPMELITIFSPIPLISYLYFSAQTVVQGTQLLAIDTGAAMGLLKRALIGDELTQKEKQALQRTLTDLASVVPIGILMLLPVSLSSTCISAS